MRILVVSQYFWPENFRINDLCSELVKRGHEVTVLTGKPNYPDGFINPLFKKNPLNFSQYDGAEIIRVPMILRGQGRSLKLVLNYLSFAFSASIWGWIKLRGLNFDVIFVFEPSPITVGLPALLQKRVKNIPVVFWALDLWPDTLEAVGIVKSGRILGLVGKLVAFIYNGCDLVLGQSKAFYDGIALYCDDPRKIKYFPSWSENIFSIPVQKTKNEITKYDGVFKILFAGNMGEAQDFPSIIRTAEVLKRNNANVRIFIVGDGRLFSWVKQKVDEKNLQGYICLLGRHPLEEMPGFYAAADALLASLKKNRIFSMTIPGKVQTYLMAGKPILAMLDGEGARVIEEAKAGFTCEPGNHDILAEQILLMSGLSRNELEELGENARKYAHREFDRGKLITQLEQWLEELVESGNSGGASL